MNSPDDWNDHITLLNSGFENYNIEYVTRKKESAGTYELNDENKTKISVEYEEDFKIAIGSKDIITTEKEYKELILPIKKGSVAGCSKILLNGEEIGRVNILSSEEIKKTNIFLKLKSFLFGFFDKKTI